MRDGWPSPSPKIGCRWRSASARGGRGPTFTVHSSLPRPRGLLQIDYGYRFILYRYSAVRLPLVEKWRHSVADVPAYPSLILDALIINCMCNTLYCCMVHPIGHPSIASHLWRAPQRTLLELRRRRFQYDGTQSAMRCAPRSQGKAVRNGAQGHGRYNL